MATSTRQVLSPQPEERKEPVKITSSILRCRRGVPRSYERRQRRNKEMLYRALNLGTVVGFIGSGCSASLGLPNWVGLAKEAVLLAWVYLERIGEDGSLSIADDRIKEYEKKLARFALKLGIRHHDLLSFFLGLHKHLYLQTKHNQNYDANSTPPKSCWNVIIQIASKLTNLSDQRPEPLKGEDLLGLVKLADKFDSKKKREDLPDLTEFSRSSEIHENDLTNVLRLVKESGIPVQKDALKYSLMFAGNLGKHYTNALKKVMRECKRLPVSEPSVTVSGDHLRFILGACKRIHEWSARRSRPFNGQGDAISFSSWLADGFANSPASSSGVHDKLLALPIHRFITSNYDLVLEQFLAAKLDQQHEEFIEKYSFSQKNHNSEKLARFAAGVSEDSRNMVFHCHGRCTEPDSMIVTEEDYQKWYLAEADGAGPAFKQTMELLVGSHPILFIGFGMNDPDLLMSLRSLSAREPDLKAQRSLFALLPESDAENKDAMERLYDQFGVHVIGYLAEGKLGPALAACLGNIKDEWTRGRDSWLLKPKIHELDVPKKSDPYWHYKFAAIKSNDVQENHKTGEGKKTEENDNVLRRLQAAPSATSVGGNPQLVVVEPRSTDGTSLHSLAGDIRAENEARLIVLVGPGGSGKSWFASLLLMKLLGNKPQDKFKGFFWSSYYAEDALTGIIRANKFFLDEESSSLTRIERFEKCLRPDYSRVSQSYPTPQHVLVFDGIERFLRSKPNQPGIGSATNGDVRDFLACLAREYPKSKDGNYRGAIVVVTTRLLPEELSSSGAEFYKVAEMTAKEAEKLTIDCTRTPQSFERDWAALVSLLGGHRYAMALASCWVRDWNRHENKPIELAQTNSENMKRLIHRLSDVGPLRRVDHMIKLTLNKLDEHEDGDKSSCLGPYRLLMKRLAVFMGTIKKETTFNYCHNLSSREWFNSTKNDHTIVKPFPDESAMWENLKTVGLLFEVEQRKHQEQSKQCVMHAVVREFVFHQMHQADARKLATFTMAGFTSGVSMVDPGKKGAETIEELFRELRGKCQDAYDNNRGKIRKGEEKKSFRQAQELCQDAFGVLRSRMLANTVARWGSYSEYVHHLVRMVDLARAYAGMRQETETDREPLFWNDCDPGLYGAKKGNPVIDERGPLFGDELAWLYHELGLALFHEGAMIDCLSVWEQGLVVNKFLDGNRIGQYTFQAYCNLGAVSIQYGRLSTAREYLLLAKEISLRAGERDHESRLNGYLALIHHLRGDLALADKEYKTVIDSLARSGNVRAECIFQRHWADLKLKMKDNEAPEHAEELIRSCRAKAEEGHFPDLVAQARLSEGHLHRTRKKYHDAIREYTIALEAAKTHGMRALEADVHCEMARLALDLGDTETARTRAIKSLQIANELHLGLRQTHGMVVLGKTTVEAGQREMGVQYLRLAKDLAVRQHYGLQAREAEKELHRLHAVELN
jgi:tetratricopeptide (TPR) repeat protein